MKNINNVVYKLMLQYNITESCAYEIINNMRNTILNDFEDENDIYLVEADVGLEELFYIL